MLLVCHAVRAQRLVTDEIKPAPVVPWVSLKAQFGYDYGRMVDFRRVFTRTLRQVKAVYREARA